MFSRVSPGAGSIPPFRQRYVLDITGGDAMLAITTIMAGKAAPESALHWRGTVQTGPTADSIALDLKSTDDGGTHPRWICAHVVTHLYAAGASCDAAAEEEISVVSCREDGQVDAPPRDRADERHRDTNRWTFSTDPGLELTTEQCAHEGVLRRGR